MRVCPNCNLEYEDKYAFCHHCGSKLQDKVEQIFCPYCGNKVETDGAFCPFCGNSLEEDTTPKVGNYTAPIDSSHSVPNAIVLPKNHVEYNRVTQSQSVYDIKDSEESFFSKRHLFTYEGRRGRMSYLTVQAFWSFITQVLTLFVLPVVFALGDAGFLLAFIVDIVFAYPMFCNISKRMHDLGWPTSWAVALCAVATLIQYGNNMTKSSAFSNSSVLYLKWIIVIILCIPLVFLLFKKGTDGPNQYGQDPL